MKIIDVHGAHILDFERFLLDQGNIEQARELGYGVIECVSDARDFLDKNKDNRTTILPSPSPRFNKGSKYDFDFFPFGYENTQLLQAMVLSSKFGLNNRIFPYFGFSLKETSNLYFDYLKELDNRAGGGFKFHSLAMQTSISELEDSKFMDFAASRKKSLLIHTGGDEFSDSRKILSLASIYPDINFCAAHFGYFRKEFLEKLSHFPNIFLDTSILSALLNEIQTGNKKHADLESIPEEVRKLNKDQIFNWVVKDYGLEDRILFGSDVKWTSRVNSSRNDELKLAEELNYPLEKKTKWLYSNALKFLRV